MSRLIVSAPQLLPALVLPPPGDAIWDVRLTRTKARRLLKELAALPYIPRVAARLDPAGEGLTLYLWPRWNDSALALLLIDYGLARLISSADIDATIGGAWVTGRLLWRALRPTEREVGV